MNNEIVRRLAESLLSKEDKTTLVAQVLLDTLDDAITEQMVELVLRARADDELADLAGESWEDERQERGEKT